MYELSTPPRSSGLLNKFFEVVENSEMEDIVNFFDANTHPEATDCADDGALAVYPMLQVVVLIVLHLGPSLLDSP
jgi:diacylglycerol kinase